MLRVPLTTYSHLPFLASIFVRRLGEGEGGEVLLCVYIRYLLLCFPTCLPSSFLFYLLFFAMSQFDWPITQTKKKEIMEASQNERFYFGVYSSSPFGSPIWVKGAATIFGMD